MKKNREENTQTMHDDQQEFAYKHVCQTVEILRNLPEFLTVVWTVLEMMGQEQGKYKLFTSIELLQCEFNNTVIFPNMPANRNAVTSKLFNLLIFHLLCFIFYTSHLCRGMQKQYINSIHFFFLCVTKVRKHAVGLEKCSVLCLNSH